jgi:hypothetical protein
MILVIVLSALIISAGGGAFFRSISALYFAIGVALMSAVNIAKLFLIKRTVKLTLEHVVSSDGKNVARVQYLLRLALTGVVFLAVAFIANQTEDFAVIWGGLAGALTLQIGAVSLKFMKLEQPEDQSAVKSAEEEGGKSEL